MRWDIVSAWKKHILEQPFIMVVGKTMAVNQNMQMAQTEILQEIT